MKPHLKHLKIIREVSGLTQEELAAALGICVRSLNNLEIHKYNPTLLHWYKLLRIKAYGGGEAYKNFRFNNERMYEFRKSRKISQKSLEQELKLPATSISKWENGQKTPSVENYVKFCLHFGLRADYFFDEY